MTERKHEPKYDHATYLSQLLPTKARALSVGNAIDRLTCEDFDAIAFRGMSGALIAPTVALLMDKNLLMVRKPEDSNNHSGRDVEGDTAARRYVIIDDLVSSGNTVRTIQKEVAVFAPGAVCIGVYEANTNSLLTPDTKTTITAKDVMALRGPLMDPSKATP